MPLRYLFGPVQPRFADENLARQRRAGACLAFNAAGNTDLMAAPRDSWEAVCGRFPAGWSPDCLVVPLSAGDIPPWVWSAPLPVVGLATGWSLLWHAYRRLATRCELVLADSAGTECLKQAGIAHARFANLFGCERSFQDFSGTDTCRDIDVLTVSNLPPAALRGQLPWLGRLVRFGQRRRVALHFGVYGTAYRQLLGRAKILFNHSLHGECTFRAFEAAATGALLFQEADNRDLPGEFRDGQECVRYTSDNLEALLDHYLEQEDARRNVTAAARALVRRFGFEDLWDQQAALIEQELPALQTRRAGRRLAPPEEELLTRCWMALGQGQPEATSLRQALESTPASAPLHNARGLHVPQAATAIGHFEAALACDPAHAIAGLNLAEALALAGRPQEAAAQARRTLRVLEARGELPPAVLEGGHYPPGFDTFRIEWEQAAWAYAGQPTAEARAKADLLRWRLYGLLAELTGNLSAAYDAVLCRPDLAVSRRQLGQVLLRAGQTEQAVHHLRRAVELDPLDVEASRSLFEALGALKDGPGQERVAADGRLLAAAAPQLVRAEVAMPAGRPGNKRKVRQGRKSEVERRTGEPERARLPELLPGVAAPMTVVPIRLVESPSARVEHQPAKAGTPTRPAGRKRVSLTMIVRNEEANLPECLASAADLVDEVVIADTGSTDRTREVARRFGARVVEFPWVDDFGAARNAALQQATGDWVWWLDADDRLDADNRNRARALFARLGDETDAYAMKVRSRLNATGTAARVLDQVRLFPNHPDIRWQYRVHEQIMPAVRRRGGDLRWSDVTIEHTGYQDRSLRRGKLERNFRLLQLDDAERPDDAYTLFNLGWTALDLGQMEQAVDWLRSSLRLTRPTQSFARKLYVLLTQAHVRREDRAEALRVCMEGRAQFPDDLELLFEEAGLLRAAGDLAGAEARLTELLTVRPGTYLASVDTGLRGYKTRHLLGELCRLQGRAGEAEGHWKAAVAERPDFAPAWQTLGTLWLAGRRWPEVEQAARALEGLAGEEMNGAVLRARGHLARKEFAAARRLLESVLGENPEAMGPRMLLTRVLLQEGRDWGAAEQALRDVLARDPQQTEARNNLAVLLRRQGRPVELSA